MGIRALFLLTAFAMAWRAMPAVAIEQKVHVVRHGKSVVLSRSEQVMNKLIALVESCSVNSTAYVVAKDTWEKILVSSSFIHVSFSNPRTLHLAASDGRARRPYQVLSLLLPLPTGQWPTHLLVNADGKTISLTKFDPLVFKGLVLESEIQLMAEQPYNSLVDIRSKR
jgi:hypothetical protein